jgi:hypothetical protein
VLEIPFYFTLFSCAGFGQITLQEDEYKEQNTYDNLRPPGTQSSLKRNKGLNQTEN